MSGPEPRNRTAGGPARGSGAAGTPGGALPAQRPTWMVMLASVMAMAAFQNFGEALDELSGRRKVPPAAVAGEAAPASPQQAAQRALARAHDQAVRDIPPAAPRLVALLKMAYAALMLLGVAAVATRDRRGRTAA